MTEYNSNTIFDFNVVYNNKEYTVEQIKDILIKCALENNFDIGIDEVETFDIPEIFITHTIPHGE